MVSNDSDFLFVRFEVGVTLEAQERLAHLTAAVEALGDEKSKSESGQVESLADDALIEWLSALPPMALATFDDEPPPSAWIPPSGLLEPGWDALSMLDAVLLGETVLHGIHVESGFAELRFTAFAWPFGGIPGILRLVEAFGVDVVRYDGGGSAEVSRAEHLRQSM